MKKTLSLTILPGIRQHAARRHAAYQYAVCVLAICLLAGCSPNSGDGSTEAIPTAGNEYPSPTQPYEPTVNSSTASLAIDAQDLHTLVILDGDLPPGYKSGQVLAQLPNLFDGIPIARHTFYQLFEHEGSGAGGLAILLYDQPDQAQLAYDHLLQGMGVDESRPVEGIGEQADIYIFYQPGAAFLFVDLLFQRCGAVVHMRLGETYKKELAISYAQRLDERLTPLVCP
jgi:hypothetical protein